MLDVKWSMKGLCVAALIGFIGLLSPGQAGARIYRYVDMGGVVHYTDNALEVPPALRPPLEEASLPVREKTVVHASPAASHTLATQKTLEKRETLERQKTHMDTRLEQLKRGKAKLDAEFAAISKEQRLLEKGRVVKHSRRAYRIYNQKVKKLDARIKDYNARRSAFNKEVEAYNARMRQFEKKRKTLNAEIQAFNQGRAAK